MNQRMNPTFPDVFLPQLKDVTLPEVFPAELTHWKAEPLADPASQTVKELDRSKKLASLTKGSRFGIALGSRGIAGLPEVAVAAVQWAKSRGFKPFLLPAMGSHGGADAATQARILRDIGLSEEEIGAPILSSMDTVRLGTTSGGVPCYFSKDAASMDAVLVINRVKSHTSFDRPIESGLTKMVAVGLGKAQGAWYVHRLGPWGLRDVLPEIARVALKNAPVAYGLALVENSDKKLIRVRGAEPEAFAATDEELLVLAKKNLARLPFEQIDVLIVEELGKEISGMGMDYAVIGRTDIRGIPNPPRPFIHKIAALSVTEASHGNAQGIGVADFIPKRVVEGLNLIDLYTNSITAAVIEKARIPLVLPNDREVIRAAVATSWRLKEEDVRLCIIRSTLHLNSIFVSKALAQELSSVDTARITGPSIPISFTDNGSLATRCPR